MRKHHQRQLLDLLETIRDAQKQGLYAECQEGTLAMIEFIDQEHGEGTLTVDLLRQYYRLLYKANMKKIDKALLRRHLYAIESSIKNELRPNKYKALFLPYYDNTWETMKSVYEAFSKDPLFETEVVIMPIIRNTNEGPKFIWEDYLTRSGIPNTHYEHYRFEIDRPDVVFYNQPYDGVNIPKFQSQNIRRYTSCMVYIPYDVKRPFSKPKPFDVYTRFESIMRCDLFVCQSLLHRQRYLKGTPLYSKALVHGHPKWDSLHAAKEKGQFTRYPQWESAFGTRCVIVLNTHYSYMIDGVDPHPGIKRLLDIVSQDDDLFLLWRPHPQAFFMKMSPDMQRMLYAANAHKRMIVDRTPSMTSAYMYADAVVSLFPSSIVMDALFLDIPVFILGRDDLQKHPDCANSLYYRAVTHEDYDQPLPDDRSNEQAREMYVKHSIYEPLDRFIRDVKEGRDPRREARAEFRRQEFPTTDGTVAKQILESVKSWLSKRDLER